MTTKDFDLQVKGLSEDGTLEGYASTFGGAPDPFGDIISAAAFGPSLVRHRREGTMPLMLFGHDAGDLPIGQWTDISEDGKGLLVKGTIALDDPVGARVYGALKGKRVRGLSIGGRTKASRPDEKRPGVRFIDEFDLYEVSIVNFPANRGAHVHAVKADSDLVLKLSAGDRLTEREMELLWKETFGLSNSQAERAVRVNLKRGQGAPDDTAKPAVKQALSDIRAALDGFLKAS